MQKYNKGKAKWILTYNKWGKMEDQIIHINTKHFGEQKISEVDIISS
jgi:hypothetical protein